MGQHSQTVIGLNPLVEQKRPHSLAELGQSPERNSRTVIYVEHQQQSKQEGANGEHEHHSCYVHQGQSLTLCVVLLAAQPESESCVLYRSYCASVSSMFRSKVLLDCLRT